jgi:hypothetical protein
MPTGRAGGLPGEYRTCGLVMLISFAVAVGANAQQVIPALDSAEPAGERPYEMVRARRVEPAPPTVRFDHLRGWRMRVDGGAEAVLQVTRAQNVWDRPVARLRYRGRGSATPTPRIFLVLPHPVVLPAGADSVDLWVYGNRWDWEHPPDTPPVRIVLHLRDRDNRPHAVSVDSVRWREWWLMHRRLPRLPRRPLRLESIEIAGGWQRDWRRVFFDSVRFYRESLASLHFGSLPKRPLTLFRGQGTGANNGPGHLAFPTRGRTILPAQRQHHFHDRVLATPGGTFAFTYHGPDGTLVYRFDPARSFSGIRAEWNGWPVGVLMNGSRVVFTNGPSLEVLRRARLHRGVVTAEYLQGTRLQLRLWQKSLVIDVINRRADAQELRFGEITGARDPRTVWIPYVTCGGSYPCVALCRTGDAHVFTSLWDDWYRSNGSELYGADETSPTTVRINGGVRYVPRTDGRRNPLFERLFLTVSPRFDEVLPTIPNPAGLHAREAADRLWQESWGPANYAKEERRGEMLRAYGIEKLIQCNHEITWRDGGESFTLRVHAAPKRGGDAALQQYITHQRGLGWLAGLYSNYTDYAPVNRFWDPDGVQRLPNGQWRSAWPRCWAEKPLSAVAFDARLAPQIERRYRTDSAYTDVQTAVAPWNYNDYDARVPGAGTFAQTFYAYGQLLRNDSRVYGGPVFSEGTYQWLYAGLADGNYGHAYDGHPLARAPLLPVFDLEQIHPKECDIGMGWTAEFCGAIPHWQAPKNIDRAIDRFLLNTMAYGHIGWLVEEQHGIERTCRSYYMLQAVQARYGLKTPKRIAYWDGTNLVSVSDAIVRDLPRTRRQLFVEYPGGLQLWLNDHPTATWTILPLSGTDRRPSFWRRLFHSTRSRFQTPGFPIVLPPAGWAAFTTDGKLFSYSLLAGTNKVDYLRCPSYVYLDGRGHWLQTPEASSNGALALFSQGRNQLRVIHISGNGPFTIRRPFHVHGALAECAAFDVHGRRLASPVVHDGPGQTSITPVAEAVRYVLRFGRKQPKAH